jgi:hypothetical protein
MLSTAHELRNEVVEELIPDLANESCARLDVELGRGSRNRGREHEQARKGRKGEKARKRGQADSTRRETCLSEEKEPTSATEAMLSRRQVE